MRRIIVVVILVIVAVGLASTVGIVGVAVDSIQFDLTQIGKSIYEARSRTGQWPKAISDLEGTTYLRHALSPKGAGRQTFCHRLAG